MGVNLIPIARNFSIHDENFAPTSGSVIDGCVTPGAHKIIRFDFLIHNIGNTDLAVGNPASHPDLFVYSAGHGHYHLKNFNEFVLYDSSGNQTGFGVKQAYCLEDNERLSPWASPIPGPWDCDTNQGISAGWADKYKKSLDCQFIVIDGLLDGAYTLVSTTNAQHIFPEDTYEDNSIRTGLQINGNSVTVINPPTRVDPSDVRIS